jgi:hypothetical protein
MSIKHATILLYKKYLALNSTLTALNSTIYSTNLQLEEIVPILNIVSYVELARHQLNDFNNTYMVIKKVVLSLTPRRCKGNSTELFSQLISFGKSIPSFITIQKRISRTYGNIKMLAICMLEQTKLEVQNSLKYLDYWALNQITKAEEALAEAKSILDFLVLPFREK